MLVLNPPLFGSTLGRALSREKFYLNTTGLSAKIMDVPKIKPILWGTSLLEFKKSGNNVPGGIPVKVYTNL